jgi:hypothetical protein
MIPYSSIRDAATLVEQRMSPTSFTKVQTSRHLNFRDLQSLTESRYVYTDELSHGALLWYIILFAFSKSHYEIANTPTLGVGIGVIVRLIATSASRREPSIMKHATAESNLRSSILGDWSAGQVSPRR